MSKTTREGALVTLAACTFLLVAETLADETCQGRMNAYASERREKHAEADNACTDEELKASGIHYRYRKGSKSGLLAQLTLKEWQVLIKWHNRCFVSIAELARGEREDIPALLNALVQTLRVLVRKENGMQQAFCSAVAIGDGLLTARHCLIKPDGTPRRDNLETEYLVYAPTVAEDGFIKFSVTTLNNWNAFVPDRRERFRALSAADIAYLAPVEAAVVRMDVDEHLDSYYCGQGMFLAGNMVSHEKAIRFSTKGNSRISDSIKIGGIDSVCFSHREPRTSATPHFCSSVGGQSGAPIYQLRGDSYKVVAIHLGARAVGAKVLYNKMLTTEGYTTRGFRQLENW